MVQNPPSEATISSAGQEFPYLYATWMFITVFTRAQPLVHIMVQIDPGYPPSSYCFMSHFIAPPTQIHYKSEALSKIPFCSLRFSFCHHAIPELEYHLFLAVSNFSINVFVDFFHILGLSLASATWGWAIMWSQGTPLNLNALCFLSSVKTLCKASFGGKVDLNSELKKILNRVSVLLCLAITLVGISSITERLSPKLQRLPHSSPPRTQALTLLADTILLRLFTTHTLPHIKSILGQQAFF